jgi:hypothetical protein
MTYAYGDITDEQLASFGDTLETDHGYESNWAREPDTDRTRFWSDLYPVRAEWRLIHDARVIESLEEAGDTCEELRRIDHWVQLPDAVAAERLAELAVSVPLEIETNVTSLSEGEGKGVTMQLFHNARPRLEELVEVTSALEAKADDLGGSHDGWEAFVVADAAERTEQPTSVRAADVDEFDLVYVWGVTSVSRFRLLLKRFTSPWARSASMQQARAIVRMSLDL